MEQLWSTLSPYIMPVFNFLVNTGIGGFIGYFIANKLIKKSNLNDIVTNVSSAVTNGIVTRNIKVDLQTANKQQIERIKKEILAEFIGAFKAIENQNILLGDIAQVVMKFKAVSGDEKEKILGHIKNITNTELVIEKEPDPIIVKLEPVKVTEKTEAINLF